MTNDTNTGTRTVYIQVDAANGIVDIPVEVSPKRILRVVRAYFRAVIFGTNPNQVPTGFVFGDLLPDGELGRTLDLIVEAYGWVAENRVARRANNGPGSVTSVVTCSTWRDDLREAIAEVLS